MVDPISNDNDEMQAATLSPQPDPHGQAAMLLVESLIHGLVARSMITTDDAIEIIATAAEVREEFVAELGEPVAVMDRSLVLLEAIRASLAGDLVEP